MSKDTIRQLSEREQARQKVSIWFGSKENFYHPFKEVLFNGIDEINNNFENGTIEILLSDDRKRVTITDSGRGIPIGGKTDNVNNYELLLLKLFAGTNYDNGEHGKMTTGTNGVGLTVTNYCSKYFEIMSYREDGAYRMKFENGGYIAKPLEKSENNLDFTGTKISFELDEEVFSHVEYDLEEILDIAKKASGVNKKIKIVVRHKDMAKEFHYDSMKEYFDEVVNNATSAIIVGSEKVYNIDRERQETYRVGTLTETRTVREKETSRVSLIMTTTPEVVQESYLNITYLKDGGSINDGIILGIRNFVNKYCKEKKLLDSKLGTVSANDVADSVSFVCNYMSTNVEFSNQTKFSTGKKLYAETIKEYVTELLEIYKTEQPADFDNFVKHILEVQKFNNKSQASIRALKKKLTEKVDSFTKIEGVVDCKVHGEEAEIFICEGKSALGSVVMARNPIFQAAMAIRGKILNCLKASYDEIFASQIVTDIIKMLGCGIEMDKKNKDLGEFDEAKLRFGKIMITADADVDGAHIICLLLTLLYKLTPKLITSGRVYIVNTPLFEIQDNKTKEYHYAFSENEKEEILSKITNSVTINRNKGLGEINANTMAMCINSENRNLTQVTPDMAEEMEKVFKIWMDEQITERKNIIENELDQYIDFE